MDKDFRGFSKAADTTQFNKFMDYRENARAEAGGDLKKFNDLMNKKHDLAPKKKGR